MYLGSKKLLHLGIYLMCVLQASSALGKEGRRPASIYSDVSKLIGIAYSNFYNRQDTAGCLHIGNALEAMKHETSLSPEQTSKIAENLSTAKYYCQDDRHSRQQVLSVLRDSIRVLNGKNERATVTDNQ